MGTARVALLAWSECPSHERALAILTELLDELDAQDAGVQVSWVETEEEADRLRFVGSPSIRVDGRELIEPEAGEPYALACRVYTLPDGRFSPLPDRDRLKRALAEALAHGGQSRRSRRPERS
jgi:hypothetical protein